MPKLLQDAIKAIWEILLVVPLPWRAASVIGLVIIIGYRVIRRLLPLFLLPEFWITSRLRRWGLRPLPGTYAFGDLIGWIIRVCRWLAWVGVIVVGVGIIAWYGRPSVEGTTLAQHIDQGIAWWYSLEGWVFTGEWASSAHTAPITESGASSPETSGSTATPRPTATPTASATSKPVTTPGPSATSTPGSTRSPTATPAYMIYVVQPGDSLSEIAKRFGISVEDLVEVNKVKYPSLVTDPASIRVGWALRIPRSSTP